MYINTQKTALNHEIMIYRSNIQKRREANGTKLL